MWHPSLMYIHLWIYKFICGPQTHDIFQTYIEDAAPPCGYATWDQIVYSSVWAALRGTTGGSGEELLLRLWQVGAWTHFLCRIWPRLTLHCPPGVLPGPHHLVPNLDFLRAPHHCKWQMALWQEVEKSVSQDTQWFEAKVQNPETNCSTNTLNNKMLDTLQKKKIFFC